MFKNVGEDIRGMGVLLFWLGILGSVIAAFALWGQSSYYNSTGILGLVVLVVGCFGSWVTSSIIYAFGEITENSERQAILMNRLCEEQKRMNESLLQLQKAQDSDNRSSSNEQSKNTSFYLPEL